MLRSVVKNSRKRRKKRWWGRAGVIDSRTAFLNLGGSHPTAAGYKISCLSAIYNS